MNDPRQKLEEIARLAALVCDGRIAPAEMATLDRLLLDDPERRSATDNTCRFTSLCAAHWPSRRRARLCFQSLPRGPRGAFFQLMKKWAALRAEARRPGTADY